MRSLGCLLIQFFLRAHHDRLDPAAWRARGYRVADPAAERTLKTSCGPVAYVRAFLVPRHGGGHGVHPLDVALGLTRDAYSPLLIGWFCRLATRLSFQVAGGLGEMFLGAAPPASAIEQWALGLARPAYVYLSDGPLPAEDGDVLVIEVNGKAVPGHRRGAPPPAGPTRAGLPVSAASRPGSTRATGPEEAAEEGGQEQERPQRHAGGDVYAPGAAGTVVCMDRSTRRCSGRSGRGSRRCGPGAGNAPRLSPGTAKVVQIVVNGETCLEQRLRRLFRGATITLDVRHKEKLWEVGRLFHREGSTELVEWVEALEELLYKGHVRALLGRLERELEGISPRGPGTKQKRGVLKKVIGYLEARVRLMDYGRLRKEDLVIATGVVEGAAALRDRRAIGQQRDEVDRGAGGGGVAAADCIEVNGDWEAFMKWSQERRTQELESGQAVQIRSQTPTQLPEAA